MSDVGLEAQRERLHAEKTLRGWNDFEWITDNGWSTKSLERPGITKALSQLRAGQAGVLVVTNLDRLSRSILPFSRLLEQAEREEWAIIALDVNIDTTTANGMEVAKTVTVFAEWERAMISKYTRAGLQAKKQAGERVGRKRKTDDEILFRAIELRENEGLTLQQIADQLTADGHSTIHGGRWRPSTIKALFDSYAHEPGGRKVRRGINVTPRTQSVRSRSGWRGTAGVGRVRQPLVSEDDFPSTVAGDQELRTRAQRLG